MRKIEWYEFPSLLAGLFVLRIAIVALIFILLGEWAFALLYRWVALWLLPHYLPIVFAVDRWALLGQPTAFGSLIGIFLGFSVTLFQLLPWLLGFGFSWWIAKGFHAVTVRFWNMPPWSDYERVFPLRKKS